MIMLRELSGEAWWVPIVRNEATVMSVNRKMTILNNAVVRPADGRMFPTSLRSAGSLGLEIGDSLLVHGFRFGE